MTTPDTVEAAPTADGGRGSRMEAPATVESVAGLPRRCGLRMAVGKDTADAAKELGDEDSGVALRLGAVNPLQ